MLGGEDDSVEISEPNNAVEGEGDSAVVGDGDELAEDVSVVGSGERGGDAGEQGALEVAFFIYLVNNCCYKKSYLLF